MIVMFFFVGQTVYDLICNINPYVMLTLQPNNVVDCPAELDVFMGNEMLFKVEVTDGNLLHNWRNYATTDRLINLCSSSYHTSFYV